MNTHDTAALVTGGASGLGLATARHLRKLGIAVQVLDLPPRTGSHDHLLADGIGFSAGDIRSTDDVGAALDQATAGGLPLRVLVNCAGVVSGARVLGRQGVHSLEDFARTIEINLIGTFNVTRLAAERMAKNDLDGEERGVVVNTASIAAFDGQIGQAAYAASKAGVSGLTLPLARDLAEYQIRVASIAPGLFETPMIAGLPEAAKTSLGAQVPHPSRLGRPDEFAALVEHIISNPMLNGETIRLDGAVRMAPR
jgi:NAD(P)-dependent dehydrogenase (short-subunit alcohol dehydrogenase family)